MARYIARVRTPLTPEESFRYVSDFRNLEQWDPGVDRAKMIRGEKPDTDTAYAVKVPGADLVYETLSFDAPRSTTLKAKNGVLTSYDRISVEPDGEGSVVTYDAELTLNGPLGLFDPLLKLAFNRIGNRAATGLRKALQG